MAEVNAERLRRLRWQCRRGTQELDHLLGTFLTTEQSALRQGDHSGFERLLDTEDDQLWDWLLLRGEPDEDSLKTLVHAIRRANQL